MTLAELASVANNYTDENFTNSMILSFANVAVSKINVALKTKLPMIDNTESYTALTDDWQHVVIIPYICWSIKMNDSSLNEAQAYLFQYEQGMRDLKKNKMTVIDKAYQTDSFSNIYTINQYRGM